MLTLSPWLVVILFIFIAAVGLIAYGLMLMIRRVFTGKGSGFGAVHAELVRINNRLTAIEKVLKDIE